MHPILGVHRDELFPVHSLGMWTRKFREGPLGTHVLLAGGTACRNHLCLVIGSGAACIHQTSVGQATPVHILPYLPPQQGAPWPPVES